MWTRFGWMAAAALVVTACGTSPQSAPTPTGVQISAPGPEAEVWPPKQPQRSVLQTYSRFDFDRFDDIFDDDDRFDDDRFARHRFLRDRDRFDRDRDRFDRDRRRNLEELDVVDAFSSSNYKDTRPGHAVDGNTDTLWANDGYQQDRAWLVVEFERNTAIDDVEIKTGVLPGVRYRLEVATRAGNWDAVTGWRRADSWDLERIRIDDRGRFLRVVFENSDINPQPRFWVFEIKAFGDDRFGRFDFDGFDRYGDRFDRVFNDRFDDIRDRLIDLLD